MQLEKQTSNGEARSRRQYDDACGLAHALDLIGERWALLVLRELAFGARRFSELKADLPGISANVLTQRLTDLEVRGLVRRAKLPSPASVQVYEATPWGLDAAPLIRSLGKWAARSPWHDPNLSFSPVSAMMSMETMFDPQRAGDLSLKLAFILNETTFAAIVKDGAFRAWRGIIEAPDVTFEGEPRALAGILYGGAPLHLMTVSGDLALAARFADIFELPPKVEVSLRG